MFVYLSLRKCSLSVLLATSVVLLQVQALCPGNTPCSGHGTCGSWDLCTCNRGWTGYDCSERVCPYSKSFGDIKDSLISGRQEHHYSECSSKGDCNRGTGNCECYAGFEGAACQRMSCPEDCNGHGTCELMSEVNTGYSQWDADKIQVCKCDPGWSGESCDKRICKPGDDPMTIEIVSDPSFQADEVQSIHFTDSAGSNALTGEFTLSYQDWRGETWTTHPIDIENAKAISVQEALQALPNQAIPDVTVSIATDNAATGDLKFLVTFTSVATPGKQNKLVANIGGCTLDGCQPVYTGVSGGTPAVAVARDTTGTKENLECSKRGTCNVGNGLCECFDGYYGEACQYQTIMT